MISHHVSSLRCIHPSREVASAMACRISLQKVSPSVASCSLSYGFGDRYCCSPYSAAQALCRPMQGGEPQEMASQNSRPLQSHIRSAVSIALCLIGIKSTMFCLNSLISANAVIARSDSFALQSTPLSKSVVLMRTQKSVTSWRFSSITGNPNVS